jgi:hypothetical protein
VTEEERKAEIRRQDYAGSEWAGGAAVAADWMARAMTAEAAMAELRVSPVVTRHDDGTITMEWPEGQRSTLVARVVLEGMLDEHNADRDYIAQLEGVIKDKDATIEVLEKQVDRLVANVIDLQARVAPWPEGEYPGEGEGHG